MAVLPAEYGNLEVLITMSENTARDSVKGFIKLLFYFLYNARLVTFCPVTSIKATAMNYCTYVPWTFLIDTPKIRHQKGVGS